MIQEKKIETYQFQVVPHSKRKKTNISKKSISNNNEQTKANKLSSRSRQFLSKFWNMSRFSLYLIMFAYLVFILFSALSAVRENQQFSPFLLLKQIVQNISTVVDGIPFLSDIVGKIENFLSDQYYKTSLFFSVFFATISILLYFCS